MLIKVRNAWDKQMEFRAAPDEAAKLRVLRAMLQAHHAGTDKPVIFDKSRGWNAHLEMVEALLGRKAKVLVPVRDLRDVIASFEKLWRKNAATRQIPQERQHYLLMQTIQGRSKLWLAREQPVGIAYNRIRDAITRGFADRMFFIDFEVLTNDPKRTMKEVYEFLEEEQYEHDFDNVEQVTHEDDVTHGIVGLHDIRTKVEPLQSTWRETLGDFAEKYGELNFWKQPLTELGPTPLQDSFETKKKQ